MAPRGVLWVCWSIKVGLLNVDLCVQHYREHLNNVKKKQTIWFRMSSLSLVFCFFCGKYCQGKKFIRMLPRGHGCITFNILDNREILKERMRILISPCQNVCLIFSLKSSKKARMTEKSGLGIREFCPKDLTKIKTASQDKEM